MVRTQLATRLSRAGRHGLGDDCMGEFHQAMDSATCKYIGIQWPSPLAVLQNLQHRVQMIILIMKVAVPFSIPHGQNSGAATGGMLCGNAVRLVSV